MLSWARSLAQAVPLRLHLLISAVGWGSAHSLQVWVRAKWGYGGAHSETPTPGDSSVCICHCCPVVVIGIINEEVGSVLPGT